MSREASRVSLDDDLAASAFLGPKGEGRRGEYIYPAGINHLKRDCFVSLSNGIAFKLQ